MAQLFAPPFTTVLDSNGNPVSGAKLYFYATGTTTPQSVYTTSALSVAHASPVVADSSGRAAAIYLDPSLVYRCKVFDASNVLIRDTDPINDATLATLQSSSGASVLGFLQAGTGAVSRSVQDKLRDVVSVKDFGATGDGLADDTAEIALAVATGKDVFFPRGTYKISSSLTPLAGQTWFADENATITGNFADYLVKGAGTTGSAISSVTATIAALTYQITMADASTIAIGDAILLHDVVADEYEVNQVEYKSGNTLYTRWAMTQPFATAANIRLFKLTTLAGFVIRGIELINSHASGGGISLTYSERCRVEKCRIPSTGYVGVSFQSSLWPEVVDSYIAETGASGVGFRVTKVGRIERNGIEGVESDESITLFKNNSHAVIQGNQITQYISAHANGRTGGNCILLDQRNCFNVISDNTLVGSATYAIYLFAGSSYNTITDNTIDRVDLGGIKIEQVSQGNLIDDNAITNVIQATDSFEGGAATAAIRVKSDCSDNLIGTANSVSSFAASGIVDSQTTTARGPSPVVDAATVTLDFGSNKIDFEWTMAGNRTLANPINAVPGQTGTIRIKQDATGSRIITYGSNWRFPGGAATGGVLSTAANAADMLRFSVASDGKLYAVLDKAFAA